MPCFMATNSAPKTDVSTVDCFFESPCTNTMFKYIKKPLLDQQETLFSAWSHKHADTYLFPWRFWCINRYCLIGIPVKLCQITFFKTAVIYFWVQRIIHQSGIVSLTNMGHNMHCCLQMSDSRYCYMG